jgi:hypothetical protein
MDEAPASDFAPNSADAAGPALSREDRLAAKLRENLRRRKAQARALDQTGEQTGGRTGRQTGGEGPSQ